MELTAEKQRDEKDGDTEDWSGEKTQARGREEWLCNKKKEDEGSARLL
jgi:hypothetical protein